MRRAVVIPLAVLAVTTFAGVSTYNRLVTASQGVDAQWAQVENVYQRRADLVPNLVETVKAAAAFEKETFTAVAAARAAVGHVEAGARVPDDPAAFGRFQQAHSSLGAAVSRLLVVAERYPELKATEAFRDLQAQLEGSENRIAVERMRFNEEARAFNTTRARFPAVLFARLFGARFGEKAYFEARPQAETAPKVAF